ncbi:hypothetical protein [Acidipropionibacterium virtanenii]|uniref:Uncharacterized protein n=1 Tax=Acidipropionibacterium virtanenii TaxID=2057246 RepID=A0A344UPT4_9ACTN|nr:hypothetical protein JS278_00085 [Acidipropionibacterium virtanenii]
MSTPPRPVPSSPRGIALIRRAAAVMLPVLTLLPSAPQRPRTPRRDERGLSQSTENAILLVGAVSVATIVVTAITAYVKSHLPT